MVGQVQVIAILMIVQGALATLMGLILAAMGPFMFWAKQQDQRSFHDPMDETMMTVLPIVYVVLGLLVLVSAIMNVIGGVRCLKFRGRTFAIVSLFTNVIPLFTCYCAPTALAVWIYGSIVLFNHEVAEAFRMAEAGHTPQEIRDSFR
jgi:hypothetical protein